MDWIEIKSKEDLPKQNCWVRCKFSKESAKEWEVFFDISGGYGYNFLMNQCKYYKIEI